MKTLRVLGAIVMALVFLFGLGSASVQAVDDSNPLGAPYIDNQEHPIGPHEVQWYRFDYNAGDPGKEPVTDLNLLYGNKSGVRFEVWTRDRLTNLSDNDPIGRGTAYGVNCDTGRPGGSCLSADFTWAGAFGTSGDYYVRVINDNPYATTARLMIQGSGVSILAPGEGTRPLAAAPPLAAATTDDPGQAMTAPDGRFTSASGATWHRFDYTANYTNPKMVDIRLVNGNVQGVGFEVWAPENLNRWWDNDPIGRGTAARIKCDSGVLDASGGCSSNDLTWRGAFGASGTYYVRVINPTDSDLQLVIQ